MMRTSANSPYAGKNTSRQVSTLITEHRRLLRRWNRVSHYISGICSGLYLPGIHQTFDVPIREIGPTRPIFLTLEAAGPRLSFVGAISRPKAGKLNWQSLFNYDFSIPMTERGGGRVLSAQNTVIARRGLELLSALVDYGDAAAADEHAWLDPAMFPTVVYARGWITGEDYSALLGFLVPNPAASLESVTARRYSAAEKVLSRRGLEKLEDVAEEMWPVLMAEFRAEYPDFQIPGEVVLDALKTRANFVHIPLHASEALAVDPDAIVHAMRKKLPGRFRYEASYKDLLLAAANPSKPLRISRLSALQLFPVETVQELPEGYTGSVLSPVKLLPPPAAVSPGDPTPAAGN